EPVGDLDQLCPCRGRDRYPRLAALLQLAGAALAGHQDFLEAGLTRLVLERVDHADEIAVESNQVAELRDVDGDEERVLTMRRAAGLALDRVGDDGVGGDEARNCL